jgi:hypothetical protein
VHSNSLYGTSEQIYIAFVHPVLDSCLSACTSYSVGTFYILGPFIQFNFLGVIRLPNMDNAKSSSLIQLGMVLVIHEKFHVDADMDGHVICHYPILLLEQAHMLLPITVAHIWLEIGTEVC